MVASISLNVSINIPMPKPVPPQSASNKVKDLSQIEPASIVTISPEATRLAAAIDNQQADS